MTDPSPLPSAAVDPLLTAPEVPRDLDTPCVVVDLERFDANVTEMQSHLDARGVALRPHLKTAKSVDVAAWVVKAGAQGLTVATVGEAEVFAAAGFDDLFVAYPMFATHPRGVRLAELATRCRLRIGVDSPEGVASVDAALGDRRREVGILVEVDCGGSRSGIGVDLMGPVLEAVDRHGLRLDGVFTHGGHSYADPALTSEAADDEATGLLAAREVVAAHGIDPRELTWSAGSTPTARAADATAVTEERPGTYMFNDRQQAVLGAARPGTHALVVAATVVSAPRPGVCILDAGAKALAKDKPAFVDGYGAICELPGAVITTLNDHHATVRLAPGQRAEIGMQVAVIPNHVCPVVNLTDQMLVVEQGVVVDTWAVSTRGRH